MTYYCTKCKNKLINVKTILNENSINYKCINCGFMFYFNKDINKIIELTYVNNNYKEIKKEN